jgi:hypothetical protein
MRRKIIEYIPDVESEELLFLESILEDLSDRKLESFCLMYRSRRKKPDTLLLLAILGFIGAAGIHRMFINHIFLGILYFFTGGLCLIGTIVDILNHKQLAQEHNEIVAMEIVSHFQ